MDRILAVLKEELGKRPSAQPLAELDIKEDNIMLTDCHMHTLCSPDGCAPLADMAAAALAAGMDAICVTDHCDLLDLRGEFDDSFRWAPIEEQLALARPQFEGRLPIRKGIELGEAWEDPQLAGRIVGQPGVDFVIGSVHNLSREDGGQDFFYVNYDCEETCHKVLGSYFNCMESLSQLSCFDVVGHVIYPLRYMNGRDGNHVTLEAYLPQLERIFRNLISRDRGIEVNTCRGQTVEDWRQTLALYRDCGGRIVTLGSDAHEPRDVGKGIAQAAALLKEYSFDLAVFAGRQPQFFKL